MKMITLQNNRYSIIKVQVSSQETEGIVGSISETTKGIEEITLTAQSQALLAERLNEMVQRFKI